MKCQAGFWGVARLLFLNAFKPHFLKPLKFKIMTELKKLDLNDELPDLSQATEAGFDLAGEYWSPQTVGEEKRVFFVGYAIEKVPNMQGDGVVELEVARFIEVVDGNKKLLSQGSKRLVSTLQNNSVYEGTPLRIVYLGKKKNKSNNFESDSFQIIPLEL